MHVRDSMEACKQAKVEKRRKRNLKGRSDPSC